MTSPRHTAFRIMAHAAADDTWSSLTNCTDGGEQRRPATAPDALTAGKYCHRPTRPESNSDLLHSRRPRNYSSTPFPHTAVNIDPASSLFPSRAHQDLASRAFRVFRVRLFLASPSLWPGLSRPAAAPPLTCAVEPLPTRALRGV